MRTTIFVIGLVLIVEGIIAVIKPGFLKGIVRVFATARLILLGALIKLGFGVFFLVAATHCQYPWLIIAVGILACLQGVLLFAMPHEKRKAWMKRILAFSNVGMRALGILAMVFGGLIAYAAGIPQ